MAELDPRWEWHDVTMMGDKERRYVKGRWKDDTMPDPTITAFIAARLAEDEAVAMAAVHRAFRPWHVEPWHDGEFLKDGRTERADVWGATGYQVTGNGALTTVAAEHIARHDPARVLREVAAKRAILARHAPREFSGTMPPYCVRCSSGDAIAPWPCDDIIDLAGIWSDHDDYKPHWAPATA